ncbi:MAG: galactonate dehydratase [Brevinema sp.]
MKIRSYELFSVPPRWLFLKIETECGLVGWGEPVIEGRADTVKAAVIELMDNYIIHQNPENIEDLWNVMYRGGFYRGGPILMSAIAGIDQALWDIKGKKYHTPVYNLMGGMCRKTIKAYSWVGGDRPDEVAKASKRRQQAGFTAIKMNATEELQFIDDYIKIDAVLERVASIRESCGKYFGIGIDFHGRVHKPMAKVLAKKLEEFDPMFLEEPILCENGESFRDIAMSCSIPIATGERLFSRWDFKTILQQGYIDIIQPDLSHAGGITECKKIASMAEAYDVALAPHCPLGPIALAACLQVDATSYNAVIQEQSIGIHYNQGCDVLDYIVGQFIFDEGHLLIPNTEGLGITINEDFVREKSLEVHNWKNPIWRHQDESFAEW